MCWPCSGSCLRARAGVGEIFCVTIFALDYYGLPKWIKPMDTRFWITVFVFCVFATGSTGYGKLIKCVSDSITKVIHANTFLKHFFNSGVFLKNYGSITVSMGCMHVIVVGHILCLKFCFISFMWVSCPKYGLCVSFIEFFKTIRPNIFL